MADYDAGHYFLTVMAPIDRNGSVEINGVRRSVIDHVRELLAALPTAQQDDARVTSGLQSPFAAVPGTHFAHVFLIDDLRYNGRRPSNPVLDLILNIQLTEPEKVDRLPHAYVVMCIDFDAPDGSDAALRGYTDGLWRGMADTLRLIFGPCEGFDKVTGAGNFFDYVRATKVTTSLPYNDYWTHEPPDRSPVKWMIAVSALMIAAAIGAWAWPLWPLDGSTLATSLLVLIAVNIALIAWFGLTPFPAAPDSDLSSILKALYIQQKFTDLSIANLGKSDIDLFDAFDAFCNDHAPASIDGPRQDPGVLRTPRGVR